MREFENCRLSRKKDVLSNNGYGSSHFHEQINDGLMVKPIKLGSRLSLYPDREIAAINEATIAGKSKDEIRDLVKLLEASRNSDPVATFLSFGKSPDQIKVTITKLQSHLEILRGDL